ncbi:MAG: hypothetical protein GY765_26955, partial [bacterium]|nr:hypothetical protein [bacterium]
SFHGRPFHRDDFSRFIPPVNEVYRQNFQSSQFETAVSREAVYWHYMNRFALESFQNSGARVLVVCYEDYLARREKWVDIICDFLGLPVKENYYSVSGTRSATATREIFLTKEEFQFLDGYRQIYDELLEKAGLNNLVDYKSIYSLYETFAPRSILENYFTGENPGYMNRRIQKLNHEMGRKIKEIRRLSSLLESE